MKDISQATALVFDHGLFLNIAHRLAKKFKRVLYHTPWENGFPTVNQCVIGDGFDSIERCDDIWKVKNEVDCFVFPDLLHSGLQLELERQGYPVWGARNGDSIELNREKFNRILKQVGLPVAKHIVVKGLTKLREHLRNEKDKYIKVSKYRGTCETHHWRDYSKDFLWLDSMAVKLGPTQDLIPFLVVDPIECTVEIGGDTYDVDGQWPSLMLHGDEEKDKCYLGAVTPFEEMPKELIDVMQAFSPVLEKERYRCQWSMETRDGRFIDATTRGGLPSTGSQLNTWKNFPEIVYHGANGELIDPIPAHKFSCETLLSVKMRKEEWTVAPVVEELKDVALYSGCCEIDGSICFPPDGHESGDVGWLVSGGDTVEEAVQKMIETAQLLPDGVSAATDELIGLIVKIQAAQDEGVHFANKIPPPEVVIES